MSNNFFSATSQLNARFSIEASTYHNEMTLAATGLLMHQKY